MRQVSLSSKISAYLSETDLTTKNTLEDSMLDLMLGDAPEIQIPLNKKNQDLRPAIIAGKTYLVDKRPVQSPNNKHYFQFNAFEESNNNPLSVIAIWGDFYSHASPRLLSSLEQLQPFLLEAFGEKCTNAIWTHTQSKSIESTTAHSIALAVETYHLTLAAYLEAMVESALKKKHPVETADQHTKALSCLISELQTHGEQITPNDIYIKLKNPEKFLDPESTLLDFDADIEKIIIANSKTIAQVLLKSNNSLANAPITINHSDNLSKGCMQHILTQETGALLCAIEEKTSILEKSCSDFSAECEIKEVSQHTETLATETITATISTNNNKQQLLTVETNTLLDPPQENVIMPQDNNGKFLINNNPVDPAKNATTTSLNTHKKPEAPKEEKSLESKNNIIRDIRTAIATREDNRSTGCCVGTSSLFKLNTKLQKFTVEFNKKYDQNNSQSAIQFFADNINNFTERSAKAFEKQGLISMNQNGRSLCQKVTDALKNNHSQPRLS